MVGALTTEGKVILMCDSCGTVWCSPQDVGTGRYSQPSADDDFATHCGVRVTKAAHWSNRAEIEQAGWGDLDWKEYDDEDV
jgi:hypothetical protein